MALAGSVNGNGEKLRVDCKVCGDWRALQNSNGRQGNHELVNIHSNAK
ncbi:uncharacterized protein G2W53_012565 [Senna tora]|uniref:Uncharacterized protein n=1 Tax=Senna tora TaxID=362788 RepID=A0A834TZA7_9FABA|nr:uncharacterized protein G2W53_012565 [Senna tora]